MRSASTDRLDAGWLQGGRHEDKSEGDLDKEGDLDLTFARVLSSSGREISLRGSPLVPSRPGFASDRGKVNGITVLDVVEEAGKLVHLLSQPLHARTGQLLEVRLDRERRERLARTHTACVLVCSQLALRSVRVISVEITAGLAWIEIREDGCEIDLDDLAARGVALTPRQFGEGRMLVECCGVSVDTYFAPIARDARTIAGAEVRTVAALEKGRSALEIALPDARGRWWR